MYSANEPSPLMNSVSSPTGVAEQFAIAEAKLRAWSSVDGEDSTDESYDEDYPGGTDSGEGQSTLVPLAGVGLNERPCDSEAFGRGGVQTLSRQSLTFPGARGLSTLMGGQSAPGKGVVPFP